MQLAANMTHLRTIPTAGATNRNQRVRRTDPCERIVCRRPHRIDAGHVQRRQVSRGDQFLGDRLHPHRGLDMARGDQQCAGLAERCDARLWLPGGGARRGNHLAPACLQAVPVDCPSAVTMCSVSAASIITNVPCSMARSMVPGAAADRH